MLIERVYADEHTREDAKKVQDLNKYRAELCNAIDEFVGEKPYIKVYGGKSE